MADLIPFPEPVTDETDRKRRLYEWCDRLLARLGYAKRVVDALTIEDLRKIVFDMDAAEVELAIRDALHPAGGPKADIFRGLKEGALKRVIKARFNDLRRDREAELLGGRRSPRPDWMDGLKLDPLGTILPLLVNLILVLRRQPQWEGVLGFNEFTVRVVLRKPPPWEAAPLDLLADMPWTDHYESLTRSWFQREDIKAAQGDVGRAVQAAARYSRFHPVHDYFATLKWDRKPRIDRWLATYFHVEDSRYARAVGPRFLISGVARILKPGCKVDHTPVLEGPQGKQKSELLRTLAVNDEWFSDRLSHVGSKDAQMEAAGVWIIEIAEMDAMTKAGNSAIKSFLTRRYDRFRPPYGRHVIRLPRQCVFAGSINPPAGGYLQDPTGARRFWPILCRGTIDRDGIERDRDQLWAETVERFRAGAPWWLETPELEALAAVEQKARFKADVWKAVVAEWIDKRTEVGLAEVLEKALGILPKAQSHSAEIRVASILTDLDFTKCRLGGGSARSPRSYRYRRESVETDPDD